MIGEGLAQLYTRNFKGKYLFLVIRTIVQVLLGQYDGLMTHYLNIQRLCHETIIDLFRINTLLYIKTVQITDLCGKHAIYHAFSQISFSRLPVLFFHLPPLVVTPCPFRLFHTKCFAPF